MLALLQAARTAAGRAPTPRVTVVLIACGERYVRAVQTTAESAIAWSTPGSIRIVIVHDSPTRDTVRAHLPTARRIEIQGDEGRFKCSSSKLKLPELPLDGLVIVLDADTFVVADLNGLADWFVARAGDSVWAAMAPESSAHYAANWYRCCSKVDYYRPHGLNAGVLVFNMTTWRRLRPPVASYLTDNATLGDQDAWNAYFQHHRNEVLELPMSWNWRGSRISGTDPADAKVLHAAGTRCAPHNDCTKEYLFAALGRQRPAKPKNGSIGFYR